MARIADLLAAGPCFSFEFFPPKSEEAERVLEQTLVELEPLRPSYVSITYGAGGTTRERTHDLVVQILRTTTMTPMAHLTCAAHTRAELQAVLERYRDAGVQNVLCLGGDPPAGLNLPEGELKYAAELVQLARDVDGFSLAVAAHPEGHPSSPNLTLDRDRTAAKLAQADFAVTQFFFRPGDYFALVESLADRGITKPVVPGIMPVTNLAGISRMAALSGAAVPREVIDRIEPYADDAAAVRRCGVEIATELCLELLAGGAPGLHFYTLNRSTATREIHANLGLGAS
ncbi:MAG TPA: methylenetetrahydrofolate reductase [Mycobacteriales bacterium]|jgi:methylenetetrahydrofolate reductase (NADPH)|nr:methylenetetrahydrofolate reductase [Mycobacteriales bacterium]